LIFTFGTQIDKLSFNNCSTYTNVSSSKPTVMYSVRLLPLHSNMGLLNYSSETVLHRLWTVWMKQFLSSGWTKCSHGS